MSVVTDALTALKNIVLLQERMDGTQRDIGRLSADVSDLNTRVQSIDKRVVRIGTLIEVAQGQKRLER